MLSSEGRTDLSIPFHLLLPHELYLEMIAQAWAERPNECCGILAGHIDESPTAGTSRQARVERRYPLINALASPTEFESEARSMLHACRDMDSQGLEMLAVYHSHPASDPVPSKKDRERSLDESIMAVIISLKGAEPQTCAWWLTADAFRAATWEIV